MSILLATALLLGDSVQIPMPELRASRVDRAPTLDGRLDDDAWRRAQASDTFTQKFPKERSRPADRTVVRVVYDEAALYIAIDCQQRGARVTPRLTRRDRQVEADWVSVSLGTTGDGKTAFEFAVNAAGVQTDTLRYRDTETSLEWDENWEVRTTITPQGWSVEYRIPFGVLRYAVVPSQKWRFQVRRYTSERQETDEWAFIPRSGAGEVSRYGTLSGLEGLPHPSKLEVRPFVLGQVTRRDAGADVDSGGTSASFSAGADVKWHVTPRLSLDATIHPDFAQVEADQLTLNLTKYEVYYPEKRPFFLEGIDIFTLPYQLVYTRRIGRTPLTPTLRTGPPFSEQLLSAPSSAPILGAAKLVGRLDDHWSVGTLTALTGSTRVDVASADGSRSRRLIAPTTLYNVLRLTRDIGDNASLGLLFTGTERSENADDYPRAIAGSLGPAAAGIPPPPAVPPSVPQGLCPNGTVVLRGSRCFNDALVGGVDWRWRSSAGDYTTDGQVYASMLQNGPARLAPDGSTVRPGDVGTGALVYVAKDGGTHWVWDGALARTDRKIDVNDLGFARRSNLLMLDAGIEYRELDRWGPFLEAHTRLELYARDNTDLLDIGRDVQLKAWGRLSNFWNVMTAVHFEPAHFDDREVGDGTALERAGLVEHELTVGTDPTKPVAASLSSVTDVIAGGFAVSESVDFMFRVLPQFDVELIPLVTHTAGEPRYASDDATTGAHVYGRLAADSAGATLRASYTFTPRLDLISYAQIFLADGRYTDFSTTPTAPGGVVPLSSLHPFAGPAPNANLEEAALNTNVVLRWEYKLGSTLYLVYSRTQSPTVNLNPGELPGLQLGAIGRASAVDLFMVKLSYWLG